MCRYFFQTHTSGKRAFTIVEMVIVITVISILLVSASSVLNTTDRQRKLYGQSCSHYIYGEVLTYINNAVTGKFIFTGDQNIFPDAYIIDMDPVDQLLILGYKVDGVTGVAQLFDLNEREAHIGLRCNNSVLMQLTGVALVLTVQRNLASDVRTSSFAFDDPNQVTGVVKVQGCYPSGEGCQDSFRIFIDRRTQKIEGELCRVAGADGVCDLW